MPAKKAAKKAAAKKETPAVEPEVPAVKGEVPAAKEAPAKKVAKKAVAKKVAAPKAEKSVPKPPKDVAKAAYLNSLARKAKGLPPDPIADWLEAEKSEGA